MKALLYCTKSKWQLFKDIITGKWLIDKIKNRNAVNGKIVAECDYELEEIYYGYEIDDFWTKTCGSQKDIKHNLLKQSCLTDDEMHQYLQPKDSYYGDCGKAIHIENLHIFDEPKELKDFEKIIGRNEFESERCDFCSKDSCENCRCNYLLVDLEKAPQNMMYVFDGEEKKVLISIHPEWLCKILNGEKTIEVRRKVLKEMLENE